MTRQRTTVPGMADAIERRRRELEITIGDFADRAGLTRQGLDPVRRGLARQYEDRTIFGIARALGWQADWYDRLVAGEEPTIVPSVTSDGKDNGTGNRDYNRLVSSVSAETRRAIDAIIDADPKSRRS